MFKITFIRKNFVVAVVFNKSVDAAKMQFGKKCNRVIVEKVAA